MLVSRILMTVISIGLTEASMLTIGQWTARESGWAEEAEPALLQNPLRTIDRRN